MAGFTVDVHLDGRGVLDTIGEDVRRGLGAPRKYLYPKYFYDAHGSQLFEQITELPEYYPTRTELAILCAERENILRRAAPRELLELGSGASTKVRTLLDARPDPATPARYVAFDVSESIVREAGEDLVRSYPGLEVHGVIGDFERHLGAIPPAEGRRLVLFLGGTIGNLEREERQAFLCQVRGLLSRGDFLLLGVDLVKDVGTCWKPRTTTARASPPTSAATSCPSSTTPSAPTSTCPCGGTAPTGTPTPPASRCTCTRRAPTAVRIADLDMTVDFAEGESIWTESSHKFTRETASAMLEEAGMTLDTWYTDERGYFGLVLARAA